MKVVIVGGVAGGASAAARLRRLDEKAHIVLCEKGEFISFANCGLPYYIGETITDESVLTLQTPTSFNNRFNVDVRINSEVVSIDKEKKSVVINNGNVSYSETYDKLILSMGASPIIPKIKGVDNDKVFTLRNIPDTKKIKKFIQNNNVKSALIVGAGFIGVEMAENLIHLGIDVSICEASNQVIAPLDFDMACDVQNYMRDKGVKLYLKNAITQIDDIGNGLQVTLENGSLNVDCVLLAIGVKPDTAIAKGVVELNDKGGIIVDENMLTSDKDIYAVGDAVETYDFISSKRTMVPLAGPANKQGRIAADNICGLKTKYTGTQGSAILKLFDMTIASTGLNEKMAKRLGYDYEKSFTFSPSHATYYPNAHNMSIKIIFDKKDATILGAQIVGYDGVDKRCDILATAIRAKMTAFDLTNLELCYAPPFGSAKDPVNMAGYTIENIMTDKVKIFHWHDIDDLLKRKDVTLLDVRTRDERSNGCIDERFKLITLDELRANLYAIDKTKPVYVHCHSGLRSYIACRILTQYGYDCYNLSGGFRLYDSIRKNL